METIAGLGCAGLLADLDELLGTKLRALYQRKAGRDLFDLAVALANGRVDPQRMVAAFLQYMAHEGHLKRTGFLGDLLSWEEGAMGRFRRRCASARSGG